MPGSASAMTAPRWKQMIVQLGRILKRQPEGSIDPALVPLEHRTLFVRAAESVIAVDGDIDPVEREQLVAFARLMR